MSQRNATIDLIRGFSILSVILLHCYIHLPMSQTILSPQWTNIIFRSGYYGVRVFFVVSGFLITNIAIQKWGGLSSIKLNQFYFRRFARIMPCLLALILASSFFQMMNVKGLTLQTTSLGEAIFSTLTFQLNWLTAKVGYLAANWDVLWSLSIEEMFYLFFPLLCITLRRKKTIIAALFAFVLLGPFARTMFSHDEIWIDRSYLSCMDGISVGCLAAIFVNEFKLTRKLSWLCLTIGLIFFSFIFFFRSQAAAIGLTKLELSVTVLQMGIGLILIASQQQIINVNRYKPITAVFTWFGRNSYEIYLTHGFIIISFTNMLYASYQTSLFIALEYIAVLLLSGVLGQLIAGYYSNPINVWLRTRRITSTFDPQKNTVSSIN